MSESVKILIDAEDKASKKVQQAGRNIEHTAERIDDVGDRAKRSTELVGAFASALGGSELANYASQLAQVTDALGDFTQVAKGSAAGAMAFRAGIAGAVAAGAYGLTTMLSDAYFGTSKWRAELKEMNAELLRTEARLDAARQKKFGESLEIAKLTGDPERQAAEVQRLMAAATAGVDNTSAALRAARNELKQIGTAWYDFHERQWETDRKEELQGMISVEEQRLEMYRSQVEALREVNSEHAKRVQAMQEEKAAQDRSDAYLKSLREQLQLTRATKEEQFRILASRNAVGDAAQKEAASLLKQLDAKTKEDTAKQKNDDYLKSLKEQLRLTQATKEERFKLLAAKETGGGAAQQEAALLLKRIDDAERRKQLAAREATGPLQAKQGRLLAGHARGTDPNMRIQQEQKDILRGVLASLRQAVTKLDNIGRAKGIDIKVHSA